MSVYLSAGVHTTLVPPHTHTRGVHTVPPSAKAMRVKICLTTVLVK